jgi:polyisoprenoid-binding protein YceI
MAKWIIDPDHSVAAFAVRHMMVSNVHGQFNNISGTIQFDPADIAHALVEAEIDVSGIYTGIQKRDEHLRSPDFFDVEKYPQVRFKSTTVESSGGNRFRLAGNLTIHGITRPVAFDAEYLGPVKGTEEGETCVGFTASTTINRGDYDIIWNVALLEKGGVVVGREVQITLDVEADPSE